tara:strand:- start:2446 stop:4107 length:1662 start_codon:yes stop_codon:yes gene_type:complete
MNNKQIRNIVREYMENIIIEQDIEISPYTPEEEKFLAKFPELKTTSIGIIYSKDTTGVREFLNRSGKDFNLTPNILHSLLKKGTVSIVPYGGYARNEDYTLQLNIPLEDLEGLSSGPAETDQDKAIATEESVESSQELANLLVTEQKRHTQSRVYTGKSRTLKRLPKGYINYLERIIQILGSKLKNEREREQLVADILDNLAHNFGLTPKQVYRSFIYYRSQNRLANVVRESVRLNEQDGIKPLEIPLSTNFDSGKYKQLSSNFIQELNISLQGKIKKFLETYKDNQINVTIEAGESQVTNFDNEVSPKKEVKAGYLSQKRGETLKTFLTTAFTDLVKKGLITKVPVINIKTVIGNTKYIKGTSDPKDPKYKKEQYVKLIISVLGKKEKVPQFNIKLMDSGQGAQFQVFNDENPNGIIMRFNNRLLAKASATKQKLSTDPNQTFNALDYGAGPGVSIYISKNRMEQAKKDELVDYRIANRYGGDPADLEIAAWNNYQYFKKNPTNYNGWSGYRKKYSQDLPPPPPPSLKRTKWLYINPNTGKLLSNVKKPMIV